MLVTARAIPNDLSSWLLLLIDFMTVLSAALSGLVFAWALPTVVAVPLVAVLWFVWVAYGPASGSPLLHNLTSTFGCCASTTQPATVAIWANLLLSLVLCLGISVLFASRHSVRLPRLGVALAIPLIVTTGFSAGVTVLKVSDQELNLMAVEARTTPLECHTLAEIEVCLWPENMAYANELASAVKQANVILRRHGFADIKAVTQVERSPNAISVAAGPGFSQADFQINIAIGYVDLHCHSSASSSAGWQRAALIALLLGMETTDIQDRFGSDVAAQAETVLFKHRDTPGAVAEWFAAGGGDEPCSGAQ